MEHSDRNRGIKEFNRGTLPFQELIAVATAYNNTTGFIVNAALCY
jgi:hypothetical protein